MKRKPTISSSELRQKWLSFAREIWNDHDFWIKALAIKGGAGAVIIAGIMAIAHLVALPFLVAAFGIALCVGLIAVGLYGVFVGTLTMGDKLAEIYYKVFSQEPPHKKPPRRKLLSQRLAESRHVRALMAHPLLKKIQQSHAWKATQRITKKQQDIFLAGLAMKGSVISVIGGVSLIVTQIFVLPVIAVGSLLTFTTILAVSTVASGLYGIYLSTRGLMHILRKGKVD
jgi:hypothetical protein